MFLPSKKSLGVETFYCSPCLGEQLALNPLVRDRDELTQLRATPDLADWTEVKLVRLVMFGNKIKTAAFDTSRRMGQPG
jgi:hypothetical protein